MEETIEELYDNAPCGYFTYSQNGLILKMNDTLASWLGYVKNEIIEKIYWTDLLTMGSRIYIETHFTPILQIQGFVREINLEMKSKSGKIIPILINSNIIKNPENNESLVRSVVLDITQRKMYEKELLLSKKNAEELVKKLSITNSELEKFNYVISHDLKAPLSTIILASQVLKEMNKEEKSNSEIRYIEYIESSAMKLSNLIEGILSFYKNEFDPSLSSEFIDVQKIVSDLVVLLNFENRHEINYPLESLFLKINPMALEQVILNLLTNAIKYNDKEKAEIQIQFGSDPNFTYISIQDNGPGIKKEDQEKIFKPFTNLGLKDNQGKLGTGIGLATVHRTIQKLGGSIELESIFGKGTKFILKIPRNVG